MVESNKVTFQKPETGSSVKASKMPKLKQRSPSEKTQSQKIKINSDSTLPDLRISAAYLTSMPQDSPAHKFDPSTTMTPTASISQLVSRYDNHQPSKKQKTIKQVLILANKERKKTSQPPILLNSPGLIIHNFQTGEETLQEMQRNRSKPGLTEQFQKVNNYTIVASGPIPGLGNETITGKHIPLELPEKHIQKESLIKTWKAETEQLLVAQTSLVETFKQELKKKQEADLLKDYRTNMHNQSIIIKNLSQPERVMIKTLDRDELEKLLKIASYNDSAPGDVVPWGTEQSFNPKKVMKKLETQDQLVRTTEQTDQSEKELLERTDLDRKVKIFNQLESISNEKQKRIEQWGYSNTESHTFQGRPPKNIQATRMSRLGKESSNDLQNLIDMGPFYQNAPAERRSQSLQKVRFDQSPAAPASIPNQFQRDNNSTSHQNLPAIQSQTAFKALKLIEKQRQQDLSRRIQEKEKKQFLKNIEKDKNQAIIVKEFIKVQVEDGLLEQVQKAKIQAKNFLEDDNKTRGRISYDNLVKLHQTATQSLSEDDKPKSKSRSPQRQAKIWEALNQNITLEERLQNFDFCKIFLPNEKLDKKEEYLDIPTYQKSKGIQLALEFAPKLKCECKTTNQELVELLLKSPLLPVVERMHGQNKQEGSKKSRLDAQVLDHLLNQLLTGKYSVSKDQLKLEGKVANHNKYLNGIDIKKILLGAQDAYTHQIFHTTSREEEQGMKEFYIESEKWFELDEIKLQERWVLDLLQKSKQEIRDDGNGMMNYLTQYYREKLQNEEQKEIVKQLRNAGHVKAEKHFKKWANQRQVHVKAQLFTEEEEDIEHQKQRLSSQHFDQQTQFRTKSDFIQGIGQDIGSICDNYFVNHLGSNLFDKDNSEKANLEQMLYLCFLEVVRQVSANSKGQALLLLKIWHSHQEQTQIKISNTFAELKQQIKKFDLHLKSLLNKYLTSVQEESKRDEEFIRMKDRYLKSLQLIDISAQHLYIQENKTRKLEQELEDMKYRLDILLPNYKQYYNDETLSYKLMKFGSDQKIGLPDDHPLQRYKGQLETQYLNLPSEAPIVKDILRLKCVLKSNLIADFALLKKQRDKIRLKTNILHLNVKIDDLNKELLKISLLRFKFEKELRQRDEEFLDSTYKLRNQHKEELLQAVLLARRDQINDIAQNVKEVQTDFSLMNAYFLFLENEKRITFDHYTKTKIMSQIEQEEMLRKAMTHNPIFIDVHKPLITMMRLVIKGESEQIVRTIKKTLMIIAEIIEARVNLLANQASSENLMNLDQYYYQFIQMKYGQDGLVEKYCESWMCSFVAHAPRDFRVEMFKRFMGLQSTGMWPFSVFKFYLQMIKTTNISVSTIFAVETDLTETYISYQKVLMFFKDLMVKISSNAFLRESVSQQLIKSVKVVCPNPIISKLMDAETFEIYVDLNRASIKARRAKSFTQVLSLLFTGDVGNIMPSVENSPSKSLTRSPSIKNSSPLGFNTNKSIAVRLPQFKENRLETIGFDTELIGDSTEKNKDRDTVTYQELKDFIIYELQLDQSDLPKIDQLLNIILIKGQEVTNPNSITRWQAIRALTERIELKMSVSAFFHIGINAMVDHENTENQWFERIFQFYSQLYPLDYKGDNMDPDVRLKYIQEKNFDGLEFVQFFIFCKDAGSVQFKQADKVFKIFSETVMYHNRQRMACEHFIELIHKFGLIKSKDFLENEMKKRFEQTKNHSFRTLTSPYIDKECQTDLTTPVHSTASIQLSPFQQYSPQSEQVSGQFNNIGGGLRRIIQTPESNETLFKSYDPHLLMKQTFAISPKVTLLQTFSSCIPQDVLNQDLVIEKIMDVDMMVPKMLEITEKTDEHVRMEPWMQYSEEEIKQSLQIAESDTQNESLFQSREKKQSKSNRLEGWSEKISKKTNQTSIKLSSPSPCKLNLPRLPNKVARSNTIVVNTTSLSEKNSISPKLSEKKKRLIDQI